MKPSVAIVGCGRVGSNLAYFLKQADYPIAGVASRTLASAERLARRLNIDRYGNQPDQMIASAQLVFLTTPDGVIEAVCRQIADQGGFAPQSVVLHCSGLHASDILQPAAAAGCQVGSLHPLQSIRPLDNDQVPESPFHNINACVEGTPAAVKVARQAAMDLGAKAFSVPTEAKALYHASAVCAANYLVALMDMALQLLEPTGLEPQAAFEVLTPLIQGTLTNIHAVGLADALTGPIARGDADTVSLHLRAIQTHKPELVALYRSLGRQTLQIAQTSGNFEPSVEKALAALLKKIE